jgi:outer membrane protein TolC
MLTALAALLAATFGCSTQHYRQSADEEVYDILAYKRRAALRDATPFTIDRPAWDPLAGLPRRFQPIVPEATALAAETLPETPPAIVGVNDALAIAVRNSRDYQDRKEDVYLTALTLTLDRHDFAPQFAGFFGADYRKTATAETWGGAGGLGVSQLLATGARVSLDITNDFLINLTRGPDPSTVTTLAGSIVQPLWRDAGRAVVQENLTQSERDVVYDLRSFARFHKTFAVNIITQYYAILRQRATVRNEWNNFQDLVRARERSEAMAEAGRMKELEVDQARQNELSARDRYVRSRQRYRSQLDNFKLTLALPTDAHIDVDASDLERLRDAGILHPDIDAEAAVRNALQTRLDLMNLHDQTYDAERKVDVAANGLGPDVDLVLTGTLGSTPDTKPVRFNRNTGTYTAGFDVDLPLDRVAERNTYRRSLINRDRTQRRYDELGDQVKQQVRQAWRNLQEAKISYDITARSLALAQKRVDSTAELRNFGRASTRDLLESQSALLDAQNAIISVLVDHAIARLELWRDIGSLRVDARGQVKGLLP